MKVRWSVAAAAVSLLPLRAQDDEAPLFVAVQGIPGSVWLQQPVELRVEVGYDAAWFASASMPLFQQRLDQPFHVVVPWLLAAEGRAVELVAPAVGVPTQRVAVGDRVVAMARGPAQRRGSRTFEVLQLRCRWLPLAPGTTSVPPVQVRYAFATRFEEDFLRGRVGVDRQEATVASPGAEFVVRPLPVPAPPGFSGAVGEFTVQASCGATTVRVGESFVLAVEIGGDGNLERFAPLAAPRLAGFHVQGVAERRTASARRFELDVLALRAGSTAVPPVPFVAFSPARGDYVTHHTAPVALRVDAATGELPPRVQERVAADQREVAAANAPSRWWAVLGAVAVAAGTLALRLRRRRSARAAAIARARLAFAAVPADAAPARLQAFEALLAAMAGETTWSEASWSHAAFGNGVDAPLRALHAALDAARFGGQAPDGREVLAVVDAGLARLR